MTKLEQNLSQGITFVLISKTYPVISCFKVVAHNVLRQYKRLIKNDAARRENPVRSLWFIHSTSGPADLPLYLWPSVGHTQPSVVLLDQPWKPSLL